MYEDVISRMVWSFSSLSAFEECPYRFFLRYIERSPTEQAFFAQFGSYVHHILQLLLTGELAESSAPDYFLSHFFDNVTEPAPTEQIFNRYFHSGLAYFEREPRFDGSVVDVEKRFRFRLDGYPFVGITDLITRSGDGLILYDHKSHQFKPRSARAVPTQTDLELDHALRQLYLYSIPIRAEYGEYPAYLIFNCYRGGYFIREPFREDRLEEAKAWAIDLIHIIENTEEWPAHPDYFLCKNLCGVKNDCVCRADE